MQFIDLAAQQKQIRAKIETNIKTVLDHGKYIMGPEVGELEKKLADFAGVKHAIGCASGTDALLLGLMAYGIGPGDAVFTTPFTFIATAEVISLLGATPVFVDIEPESFNMDPNLLEKAIQAVRSNDSTVYPIPSEINALELKGVIAVDLFGLPADYKRIEAIGKEYGLFVIEDAAQSIGAESNGRKAGAFGDITCASFFPAKPLGCYGDGGMCFTSDDDLAEIMESLRVHGKGRHKYDNVRVGVNGRLDTLQAAVLLAKLEVFAEEIKLRQIVARRYSELLDSCPDIRSPAIPSEVTSAWAQHSILAQDENSRSQLRAKLKENGIPTAIYYPKPLHLQTAFRPLGYQPGSFPVSEDFSTRIFSLPMHPYLTEQEQRKITDCIGRAA
jgi:dTDP-4-amino-4,6-dideoxygalactose transaminase